MLKWVIINDDTIAAAAPQQSGRFTRDSIAYWQVAISAGSEGVTRIELWL